MDAITNVPTPANEPVQWYPAGSPQRAALESALTEQHRSDPIALNQYIGGRWSTAGGPEFLVRQPHAHRKVLGYGNESTHFDTESAITAALAAGPAWRAMDFDSRAAILLRTADLIAGPYRAKLNAATMLGQSKTAIQAEIDSACELIDFLRFNVAFARQILAEQPISSANVWNRTDHRGLEGFVLAITPFNFTAIAGNLPTAPALMGNTIVWKPSPTQQYSANLFLEILIEAGLPPGVINMVTGSGIPVGEVALQHRDLAGIHFTGSTATFHYLWQTVGNNIANYRTYPRLVGETGGKDFIVAHPSADVDVLRTAMIRGAFEYQGQKCSAASRAYVPESIWNEMADGLLHEVDQLPMGSPLDFANFLGAVIDDRSFKKLQAVLDKAANDPNAEVLVGGGCNNQDGYFVEPTIIKCSDPQAEFLSDEYFGPILAVYVYPDDEFEQTLGLVDETSPYALTGAIIATDRAAVIQASERLRNAAGNFYINDKPTGAVVGQQPFGGARASGTNDKAGAPQNLLRWTSARSIKETLLPPRDHRY